MNKVKNFIFIKLCNDYFENFKRDERLRNDIVKVIFEDGSSECRLYLHNFPYYVVIPEDNVMINDLSKKTWTGFKNESEIINFIRSNRDNENLSSVLRRFSQGNSYIYTLKPNTNNPIDTKEYLKKRKEFILKHPLSNTSQPDDECYIS